MPNLKALEFSSEVPIIIEVEGKDLVSQVVKEALLRNLRRYRTS